LTDWLSTIRIDGDGLRLLIPGEAAHHNEMMPPTVTE
jgi:hypothetical protein